MTADFIEEVRVCELLGHKTTEREQCLFESDQEQAEADDNKYKSDEDAPQIRDARTNNEQLKRKEEYDDRRNIFCAVPYEYEAVAYQIHWRAIP